MNHFTDESESTWAYVRTALIVFAYLASKAEEKSRNLAAEVEVELQGVQKNTIQKATHRMLEDLKIELLVPRIIETVAQSFDAALQEAKWTKWLLYISQTFGIVAAGILLQSHDKLPAGSVWPLGVYRVGTALGLLMLFARGRQKIGK
jgi:hypothetical protein